MKNKRPGRTGPESAREDNKVNVKVRRARPDDVPAIYACQAAAYESHGPAGLCDKRVLKMQIKAFPEGQLVATIEKQIVGYAMSLIVQLDEESPWYFYSEITGDGTFSTHDPAGDTLYGADIAVHPNYRGNQIAGKLYESRVNILRRFCAVWSPGAAFPDTANMPGECRPKNTSKKWGDVN